jgi:eukaryotic-like serine/threonine-protein kinase
MNTEGKGPGPRGREFTGTQRFRCPKLLGEGRLGLVYRVDDMETGRHVALKTLPKLDADRIYYIKQEFRSLRGIRHGNLVELYELFVDGDHCFFTMELINGRPFTEYIWSQDGGPSSKAGLTAPALIALRRALRQLARGAAALHRRNKLHCDIKPDNVLVTLEGRVVLLDFDLVTRLQREDEHNADHTGANGTAQYMSPEQLHSEPLSSATDWYSVGVMLFEALAGEVPLNGSDDKIWHTIKSFTLPSLQKLAPGTPHDLDTLAQALLHTDPKRRAGETEILEAAGDVNRISTHTPFGQSRAVESGPFVGRAKEMVALHAIFERSSREGPALVCIEGVSGIGKTELIESFLQSVGTKALLLRGACHHQESVPFKAFDSLVDDLSQYLFLRERDRATVPVPQYTSALIRVFPVLGRVESLSSADNLDAATAPQEIRRLAFRALRDLLTELADARPLILWIDDLQWGDADSVPLFRELLRLPDAPRLMLMVSYRSEDRAESVSLRSLPGIHEAKEAWVHPIVLDPLNPEESRELAAELLTDAPGASFIDDIAEEATGSPLFLVELARHVADGLDNDASDPLGGGRLKQILRLRFSLLRERERRILEVVSVAGKPVDRSLVLKAAGLGEGGRLDILRLIQENLVRLTELDARPAIEIYHDSFRQVVLADLGAERRRGLHRQLAEALRSQPVPDPEALLLHYREAGETATARGYARHAAENAMATLAFDRAAELFEWLLSGDDQDSERWKLCQKRAEALANAGRAKEAGESFEAAAEALETRTSGGEDKVAERALDLRRQAAEQHLRGGYVEQGIKVVSQVLRAIDLRYPASAWQAWVSMLAWRAKLQLRGLGYKKRSADQIPAVDLARIDACWSAGLGLGWIDRTRTAAFQARGTLLALKAGEPSRVARALAAEASQLMSFGGAARQRRSEAVLADAKRLVADIDDPSLSAFLVLMEGTMAFYDARWRRALELCRRSLEMLREQSRALSWERTTAHLLSLGALTYLGELGELRRVLPALLDEAEARGDLLSASSLLASGVPNLLWLSLDQPKEARRRADKAIARWAPGDFQFPHYMRLIASTQIDLYLGDGEAAWVKFKETWPRLVASFLPIVENLRITLCHLQARAALAAATSRSERPLPSRWGPFGDGRQGLLRVAEASAAWLEREEAAWAMPLALSVRAGVAAARGKVQEATAGLGQAARLFEGVDMALYAAAARYQEGTLRGGEVGWAAQQAGETWMQGNGVVNPGKLAAMLVPGVRG